MAKQTINIGTGPDDNTGDHLRGAFTKVNDNFDELYLVAGVPTLTTKGDILGFDTAETRLPVGADNQVLVADSLEATGLKWIAIPAASALGTTGADVDVSAAAPPANGQVLTATGATTATWQTPSGGGGVANPLTADLYTAGFNLLTADEATATDADDVVIKGGDNSYHAAGFPPTNGRGGDIVLQPGLNGGGHYTTGYGDSDLNSMIELRQAPGQNDNVPVTIGTQNSATGTGSHLKIQSGAYTGGTGFESGGNISIACGYTSGQSYGGSAYMTAGDSAYGRGGYVTIRAGTTNLNDGTKNSDRGGRVHIEGGHTKDNSEGGNIEITAGNSEGINSNSRGGTVKIKSGSSANGTYSAGGYGSAFIELWAGNTQGAGAEGSHIRLIPGLGGAGGTDGVIQIKGAGYAGDSQIDMYSGSFKTSLSPGTLTGDVTFTLPDSNGTALQALLTDGSGNTYWGAPSADNWMVANGGSNFAIAPQAGTATYNNIAVGNDATANSGSNAICIGTSSSAGLAGLIIGANITQSGNTHTMIGHNATGCFGGNGCTIVGNSAQAGASSVPCSNSVVIGGNATVLRNSAVAIGQNATASNASDVVIGDGASTANALTGGFHTVIGRGATVTTGSTYGNVIVGQGSQAESSRQVVIGQGLDATDVTGDVTDSVKIGSAHATNKNIMHMHSKGKMHLVGAEAMFVAPSYTLTQIGALPLIAGAMIYVSDATGASLTGSQCFCNGTVWVDVTTGAAVV